MTIIYPKKSDFLKKNVSIKILALEFLRNGHSNFDSTIPEQI